MSFTYDPTLPTDRDKVRIMIRDTDTANPDRQLYQDEEIDAVLALQASDLNLSAAFLLDGITANAALLAKLEKIGDYTINSNPAQNDTLTLAASSLLNLFCRGDFATPTRIPDGVLFYAAIFITAPAMLLESMV